MYRKQRIAVYWKDGDAVDAEELISIIVPVYNVELYLEECIRSILNQSYTHFEAILVDDCSTDRSGDICDEWAAVDERIRVVHKKMNEGLSCARNTGVELSVGSYVCFVDSDDCVFPDYLRVLYENAVLFHADVSWCSFEKFEDILPPAAELENRPVLVDKQKLYEYLSENCNKPEFVVAWNKLIRREIACRLVFPPGRLHEDEFYINDLVEQVECVVETDARMYGYRQRTDSLTGSDNIMDIRHLDILDAAEERVKRCRNLNREIYHRSLISYRGAIIRLYRTFSTGTVGSGLKRRFLKSFLKYPAGSIRGTKRWLLFLLDSDRFYEKYWR